MPQPVALQSIWGKRDALTSLNSRKILPKVNVSLVSRLKSKSTDVGWHTAKVRPLVTVAVGSGQACRSTKIRVTITGAQATQSWPTSQSQDTKQHWKRLMATLLDLNTTQTQQQIQLEQLGTMNLKVFVALMDQSKDAKVSYTFTGTKAYVVSTVDPGHGEKCPSTLMVKRLPMQTKNTSRKRSQKSLRQVI